MALKPPDTVNAGPIVVTRSGHTIIHVDLTQYAQRSWWTGAAEVVHKVMTCGPILARIWLAVIHIQLTVLSLEALGAVARI